MSFIEKKKVSNYLEQLPNVISTPIITFSRNNIGLSQNEEEI